MAHSADLSGYGSPSSSLPLVSVVLPSFREADIAAGSVARIAATLSRVVGPQWEIVVVDDGGGDFTEDAWIDDPKVRLIRLPENRGKGAAVAAGMVAATGQARIFTDADLPYDTGLIPVMASYLLEGPYHLVLGDRNLSRSSFNQKPTGVRRGLSAVATFFIGTLVTGGVFDTQCGIKGIRGDVADRLFPLITIDRFAFDVELVYLALRFNCDIKRVPVQLVERRTPSTVRPFVDAARSFRDILRIKRNAMAGRYESEELDRLVWQDFTERSDTLGRRSG